MILKYKDMLQLMIDATGEEEGEAEGNDNLDEADKCPAQQKGGKLTNEQVVWQAIGILLAGYETTANALAYTSYLLALNPDIQEKLQSEIDDYFDDKPVRLYTTDHYFMHVWSSSTTSIYTVFVPIKRKI